MTILSRDGYIRLTYESFLKYEMLHLFSGMDEERPTASGVGANFSTITGYTEWVTHDSPAITIGWDWEVTGVQGKARLVQTGTPGRNLMFVDQHGQDLGPAQTTAMLLDWLNAFHWQAETLTAISI
jgi:hypothetical protein